MNNEGKRGWNLGPLPAGPVIFTAHGAHAALAQFPHVHKSALEPPRWRLRALADLREESAGHKVLVLQERDALAAVELLGQIRHVRLQLGKAWWQEGRGEWISNPFPSWESRGPWSSMVPTPYLYGFPLGSETPSLPSAAGSSASSAQRGGSWCRRQTGLRALERGSGLEALWKACVGTCCAQGLEGEVRPQRHLLGDRCGQAAPASPPQWAKGLEKPVK